MELKLEKPWNEVKALMIEIVPELADLDLDYEKGKEETLIETIAAKMNKSKEDTVGWIESVSHTSSRAS